MSNSPSRIATRRHNAIRVSKAITWTGVIVFVAGLLAVVLQVLEEKLSWGWYDSTNWGTGIMWLFFGVTAMIFAFILLLGGGIAQSVLKRKPVRS